MPAVIAIVGRPNVGKSTLFNRLTKSRAALVADYAGLTRDRQYGQGSFQDNHFIVIDTGGITEDKQGIETKMGAQTAAAINESDMILWLVDARAGVTNADYQILSQLRNQQKPIILVVNKIDGHDPDVVCAEFYEFGLTEVMAIAAAHGRGVNQLLERIFSDPSVQADEPDTALEDAGIKVAIVGRPNVGKSTLVNRILGEDRVVVYDQPGSTRDSIFIPFTRRDERYTIVDTAGVRRRAKTKLAIEKFSVVKTLQAIDYANVVVMVFDASDALTEQDLNLLGHILQTGRALVLACNKWDGLSSDCKSQFLNEFDRRLGFVDFVRCHKISALHGTGVGDLFKSIKEAYRSAHIKVSTSELNRLLEQALHEHQPPMVRGRRIKLRYAHMGGSNPPRIVIHGNQTTRLADSYKRYLVNYFRKALKLVGTPLTLELQTSDNPFAGRRNKLTPRQIQSRKRLMRHVKKSKA